MHSLFDELHNELRFSTISCRVMKIDAQPFQTQYERDDSMLRFSGRRFYSIAILRPYANPVSALNITKHGDIDEFKSRLSECHKAFDARPPDPRRFDSRPDLF